MDFLSFTFVLHVCFINQVDDGRDGSVLMSVCAGANGSERVVATSSAAARA